jgi:hypothetical protein
MAILIKLTTIPFRARNGMKGSFSSVHCHWEILSDALDNNGKGAAFSTDWNALASCMMTVSIKLDLEVDLQGSTAVSI